jgi:hypothetical protein
MTPQRHARHPLLRRALLAASFLGLVGAALGARSRLGSPPPPEQISHPWYPERTELDSAEFRRIVLGRWRFVPSLRMREPERWKGAQVWQVVIERPRAGLLERFKQFLSASAARRRSGRIALLLRFQDAAGTDFDTTTIDADFDGWMRRVSDASDESPNRLAFSLKSSPDDMLFELPVFADPPRRTFLPNRFVPYRRADSSPPPWTTPLPPPLDSLAMRAGIQGRWRFVPSEDHLHPVEWALGYVWQIVVEPCDDRTDPTYQDWKRVMSYTQSRFTRHRDDLLADLRIRFLDAEGRALDTIAFASRFDAASRSIEGRAFAREKWPEVLFTLADDDTLLFEGAYTRIREPESIPEPHEARIPPQR